MTLLVTKHLEITGGHTASGRQDNPCDVALVVTSKVQRRFGGQITDETRRSV